MESDIMNKFEHSIENPELQGISLEPSNSYSDSTFEPNHDYLDQDWIHQDSGDLFSQTLTKVSSNSITSINDQSCLDENILNSFFYSAAISDKEKTFQQIG